ncbi:MAG TPA: MaoC/PaaZ C-terminal domain-containing protein [Anaeromyxobacteraceae bacterium]|nr:MaoC/PaaZ C-terminal domain-containing protein [Anaeromyxobacteraceae bacterium]
MKALSDFRAGDELELVRTCARYTPIYYAAVSGDFNPIHIDPEVGRLAGQPGAILQGLCTLAWMAEACDRFFGAPGRATRLEARFARPVNPGDDVTYRVRCVAVEGGRVRVEVSARNQRGEDVLRNASAEAVIEPPRGGEGRP